MKKAERMRSLQNSRPRAKNRGEMPSLFERLIVAANYITFGLVGFVWLIINAIRNNRMSSYMQYHIFQSFFLVMFYFLFIKFIEFIAMILCWIPFLRGLVTRLLFYINLPVIGHYSIISGTVALVILYLVLTSIQGLYSYIPWVSDIIGKNVRR